MPSLEEDLRVDPRSTIIDMYKFGPQRGSFPNAVMNPTGSHSALGVPYSPSTLNARGAVKPEELSGLGICMAFNLLGKHNS